MYLPPDHDPLNFQKALERLEVLFKAPEEGCQEEMHLTLVDLIHGLSEVSTEELKSLSGRVSSVLSQIATFDELIKKSESVFQKSMMLLGLKSDLKKDLESIPSAMSSKIKEALHEKDYENFENLISILPKGLKGRESLLEEFFRGVLEQWELEQWECFEADKIASLMAAGARRESFLQEAFRGILGQGLYDRAGFITSLMAAGARRESLLEEACRGVLGQGKYYEVVQIASLMAAGETREILLEEDFRGALGQGKYYEVGLIANFMAAGARRESLLEEAYRGVLGQGKYDRAGFIAIFMAAGARRESLLEEAYRGVLGQGKYDRAGCIASNMAAGKRRESFLEEVFRGLLEKGDYKLAIQILGKMRVEPINSDLFKGMHEKMPIHFRMNLFKTLPNLNSEPSFLLSLKRTLFPFSLPPTEKGLCIPIFARDIPAPDSETSLEELKFTLLSLKETEDLLVLSQPLGIQDVPLLKWFALYNEPEGSRLRSRAFRELTEAQQNNLRNLSPQELSRFWALNEKKMIEEGCLNLYHRIENQAPLWSQGELSTAEERKQVLYDRMSSLTRHLLQHAKEKTEDKEAILAQLAGLSGRCEGVLTEIESMYRLFCFQDTSPASLEAALEAESFYARQGMIDLFINGHEPLRDVHRATVFKNLVASATGMPFLLEGPFEQNPYYRNAAEDLAPEFFKLFALSYGETFIKQLEEIMKNSSERSLYKVEVKNGEFALLSELLLKDMAKLGLFEEASLEERKEQLLGALEDPENWEGAMNLKDRFLYMAAETKEEAIDLLSKENLDLAEQVFLDKLLLYPLLREKLTQEKVADYLVQKGFFKQENQPNIS